MIRLWYGLLVCEIALLARQALNDSPDWRLVGIDVVVIALIIFRIEGETTPRIR